LLRKTTIPSVLLYLNMVNTRVQRGGSIKHSFTLVI
jgi:hypothetical protein